MEKNMDGTYAFQGRYTEPESLDSVQHLDNDQYD
jgi:hypothetical protein